MRCECRNEDDRIAVLRNGRLVDVLETSETDADEVTTLMIGEALKALDRPAPFDAAAAAPVIEVRDVQGGSAKGVSFDVRPGGTTRVLESCLETP